MMANSNFMVSGPRRHCSSTWRDGSAWAPASIHILVTGSTGSSLIWFLLFAQVTLDCRELFCKSNLVGLDLSFILRTYFWGSNFLRGLLWFLVFWFFCLFFLSYLDSLLEQSVIFLWTYNFLPMLQPLCEWEWMCLGTHRCVCTCACVHVGQDEWMCVCGGGGYLKFFFSYFVWKSLFYRFSRV